MWEAFSEMQISWDLPRYNECKITLARKQAKLLLCCWMHKYWFWWQQSRIFIWSARADRNQLKSVWSILIGLLDQTSSYGWVTIYIQILTKTRGYPYVKTTEKFRKNREYNARIRVWSQQRDKLMQVTLQLYHFTTPKGVKFPDNN